MSRLIDRILASFGVPNLVSLLGEEQDFENLAGYVHNVLNEAAVISIDSVAEYYHRELVSHRKGHWSITDFPNMAPPFGSVFLEFRLPQNVLSVFQAFRSGGILFSAHEVSEDEQYPLSEATLQEPMADTPMQRRVGRDEETIWVGRHSGLRWILQAMLFVEDAGEFPLPVGPIVCWDWFIDEQGKNFLPGNRSIGIFATQGILDNTDGWFYFEQAFLYPAFLAISFMHCKNVTLIENKPTLNRAQRRRKEKPLVKYYTLEIEPMKQVLRTEGKSEEVGLKRALHICRGHFVDYSKGNGLFGKYHGVYWKDAHVRGHLSEGAVVKDYSVKV